MRDHSTVLITGGSRGIGAAVARLAAEAGYAVAVNYVADREAAEALVVAIEASGGRSCAVQGDVAVEADVVRLFEQVDRAFGGLTALVNSAGLSGQGCEVADYSAAGLERLLSVNVIGTMLCCREAMRRMSTRRGGKGGVIINVSSMAATIGGRAGSSDYAASKAAVDSFTAGLAKEAGVAGVRVCSVRPGMTRSDMTAELDADPSLMADIAGTIPMHRIAEADEVARPILWLMSEQASFVSGACLDVSGGGFLVGKPLD